MRLDGAGEQLKLSLRRSWFKRSRAVTARSVNRADNLRTADGHVTAGAVAGQTHGGGVYLTNEVFLYRVVGFIESAAGQIVELEDCYRLDVVRVPVTDVRSRRLRVVTPAPIAS